MKYYHWLYAVVTIMFTVSGFYPENTFRDFMTQQQIAYIASVLLTAGYAHCESWLDSEKILLGQKIEHGLSAAFRVLFIVAMFFGFGYWKLWALAGVLISVSLLAFFSLYFTVRLNLRIGQKWYYVGKTAAYDKILGFWKWPIEIILTLSAFTVL